MNHKNILISVINWNGSSATNRCLRSLLCQSQKSTILVTDNNSIIEKFKLDDDLKDRVMMLSNNTNLGFAGAHNKAISYAISEGFDYILLMNNDAYFSSSEDLAKLVNCAIKNNADAVSPIIVSDKDTSKVWFAGGELNKKRASTKHLYLGESVDKAPSKDAEVSFLTGCSLLLRLKGVHMLDERYFLYWEDADWCAEAYKKGKKMLLCSTSKVIHQVSSSLGSRSPTYAYYNIRNRLLFARKWSKKTFPIIYLSNIFLSLKYVLNSALHDSINLPSMLMCVTRAQLHGLFGRGGML